MNEKERVCALFFFSQSLDFSHARLYNKVKMRYCARLREPQIFESEISK